MKLILRDGSVSQETIYPKTVKEVHLLEAVSSKGNAIAPITEFYKEIMRFGQVNVESVHFFKKNKRDGRPDSYYFNITFICSPNFSGRDVNRVIGAAEKSLLKRGLISGVEGSIHGEVDYSNLD